MSIGTPESQSGRSWKRLAPILVIAAVLVLLVVARFSGLVDLDALQERAGQAISSVSNNPLGPILLIGLFCVSAFIAIPQFVLIGVAVVAFGAGWGSVWAWAATLASGTLTFWIGRVSGGAVLNRFSNDRIDQFRRFISRNCFAASAIVRNMPTGPFLVVNMVFGAVRAPYLQFVGGMALGIMPKIALVAFGLQAIQAALEGRLWIAALAAAAALAVFVGGWFYVRHRRRSGENLSLKADEAVDTAV